MPKAKVTTNAINEYLQIIRSLGENADDVVKRPCMRGVPSLPTRYPPTLALFPSMKAGAQKATPKMELRLWRKLGYRIRSALQICRMITVSSIP